MKKMTMRKLLENIVVKAAEKNVTNIKLICCDNGEVIEAKHPIDLIVGMSEDGINLLWEVYVVCAKIFDNYMTVVFDPDIEQRNGDPDFDANLW